MKIPASLKSSTLIIAVTAGSVFAHPDDHKVRDTLPRYAPGQRAAAGGPVFSADGVTLLSWVPLPDFDAYFESPLDNANDCWGYTTPSGREYAILGTYPGTAFVEITDPVNPVIVGAVAGPDSLWRDIKVYQHYAYAVSEGGGGIQVIDMGQIDAGIVELVNTITTGGNTDTHNVALNADSGYLYRCGGGSNDGLRIYSLADPASPEWVAEWHDRYVHDAQIVSFTDGPYANREIAFCCAGFNGGWVETGLSIVDVTDKNDIFVISHLQFPSAAYSHQGWLSADHQIFYLNDELDESTFGGTTTTHVIDVSNLEEPFETTTFTSGVGTTDHNLYVRGDFIFEANYRSGLRIFDASSDPLNPVQVGFFDTWPEDDQTNTNGLWSNYPYFASGVVIGSDREKGLFVWQVDALSSSCPADLNSEGTVNIEDLLELLSVWGPNPGHPADLDGDGFVGTSDLLILLAAWGPCP